MKEKRVKQIEQLKIRKKKGRQKVRKKKQRKKDSLKERTYRMN